MEAKQQQKELDNGSMKIEYIPLRILPAPSVDHYFS